MTHSYLLAESADRDIDEHFLFIAQHSHEAAIRFFENTVSTLERLAEMPELGQMEHFGKKELADLRVWQVRGFKNYLIFYRPIERGIEVIRVLHAARDIDALFEEST